MFTKKERNEIRVIIVLFTIAMCFVVEFVGWLLSPDELIIHEECIIINSTWMIIEAREEYGIYNITYNNVTITGDNIILLEEVKDYLKVSDGIPYINTIYVDENEYCNGNVNNGYIYITLCDEPLVFRRHTIEVDEFLAFVLYHEIAHVKFDVDNSCQCLCDNYANEMLKELGIR